MNVTHTRIASIAIIGALAPLWWTWAVSNLIYGFFVLGGSPEHPSTTFARASILLPSLLLGLCVGFVLSLLARGFLLQGWLLFLVALLVGALAFGWVSGVGYTVLWQLFSSAGNLTFLLSTLLIPLVAFMRARRG